MITFPWSSKKVGPTTSTGNIHWIFAATVNENVTKEGVQALIAEATELTKQEKGCLAYEWHLSEDGKSVHAYERYTDSEAAMVHVSDTFSKISEKVTKVMTPTGLTIYGEASDDLREAGKGFGATHFERIGGFVH